MSDFWNRAWTRLRGMESDNNEFYGHAALFSEYCRLPFRIPIRGLLQHGWSFGPGLPLVDGDGNWLARDTRLHVWNPENEAHCRDHGYVDVRIIGAPLLYLAPLPEPPRMKSNSLLIFPSHSVDSEPFIEDGLTLVARYVQEIQPIITSFASTTVCLYYREFDDIRIRQHLQDCGLTVVTLGHRDHSGDFVQRFRDLVLEHEYVSTNSYSTALFYSLYLGRKTFVHGRFFANKLSLGKPDWDTIHHTMEARYPQLLWENFTNIPHRDIGRQELGEEWKCKPEELRDTLGWTSRQQLRAIGRRITTAVARRIGPSTSTTRSYRWPRRPRMK